jgi:hypothetical protein
MGCPAGQICVVDPQKLTGFSPGCGQCSSDAMARGLGAGDCPEIESETVCSPVDAGLADFALCSYTDGGDICSAIGGHNCMTIQGSCYSRCRG